MTTLEQLSAAIGTRRGLAAADRLCELCVELLGADAAAIALVFDGANAGTLGVSSTDARRFDEVQFTLGEGPCLQSVADRAPVLVPDLSDATQVRWPQYTPAMLALNVWAVFAIPLVVAGEYVGALDLFRRQPGRLSTEQLEGALAVVELAQLPLFDLLSDDRHDAAGDPDSHEWQALSTLTRVEVSQATGMIVGQLDVEPAEALVLLRAHAYAAGASATAVAQDILAGRLRLTL